jgi:hypothetical protein
MITKRQQLHDHQTRARTQVTTPSPPHQDLFARPLSLVDLLNTLAGNIGQTDPLRSAQVGRYAVELGEAVDNYADLCEHETDFSIEIFDRLGPGIGLAQRVLEVLDGPASGERPTVGELIERLRQFDLNLEVWVAVPSSVEGYIPLDGTASEGGDDNPACGHATTFVALGARET